MPQFNIEPSTSNLKPFQRERIQFTFVPSVRGIAENEFKQTERLQEERLVLMHEHEMEMDNVRQEFEQIAELNNRIERVRSDLI